MTPAVHFVCVNFNGAEHTARWLESVGAQRLAPGLRTSAVVVDNASRPDELARLEEACARHPGVHLVRSDRNVGYFRGLNLGLARLGRAAPDLVVVGNNDVEFEPDFAAKLAARSYPEDVLVVAPDVVTRDGYHQNPHVPEPFSRRRKLLLAAYFSSYAWARLLTLGSRSLQRLRGGRRNALAGTSRYIHMGIGACYVLRPAFFRSFDRLGDAIFLYGEEALLAGQVASARGRTYYDAGLHVAHAESAALSRVPSRVVWEYGRTSFPVYRRFL
jgi:GT2 family glycosyltransferase